MPNNFTDFNYIRVNEPHFFQPIGIAEWITFLHYVLFWIAITWQFLIYKGNILTFNSLQSLDSLAAFSLNRLVIQDTNATIFWRLYAFGFDCLTPPINCLKFISDYPTNRKKKTGIGIYFIEGKLLQFRILPKVEASYRGSIRSFKNMYGERSNLIGGSAEISAGIFDSAKPCLYQAYRTLILSFKKKRVQYYQEVVHIHCTAVLCSFLNPEQFISSVVEWAISTNRWASYRKAVSNCFNQFFFIINFLTPNTTSRVAGFTTREI